jgi:hypothetical protein
MLAVSLFQSKKSLTELATDLLPPPVEFNPQMVGDTEMMVAVNSVESTFWLEPDSYVRVENFAIAADREFGITDPSSENQYPAAPLILVGPVKCSKSTMLGVIPGILSHRYRLKVAAGLSPSLPVVLKWNISLGHVPFDALLALRASIKRLALELGIEVLPNKNVSSLPECIEATKTTFFDFVRQAAKRNICVWLYVDEIQVLDSHLSKSP